MRASYHSRDEAPAIEAPDGTVIHELIAPASSPAEGHSVAWIRVPPGVAVAEHKHFELEETYTIVQGRGRMKLDGATREMGPGEAVIIRPGQWHTIRAAGDEPVEMVVTCAPPWNPDDQVFRDDA